MNEYISREELRKHLKECYDDELFDADMKKAVIGIDIYVENMPSADVQPVKQWYSVEENQPDSVGDDVIVVDSYGKYHIAYYLSGSENWMNQDTREPIKDVVKWRYLGGDSE